MAVRSMPIQVSMQGDAHVQNITRDSGAVLSSTQLRAGILTLFIKHTTASVLIIEDEPGIRADTKDNMGPSDSRRSADGNTISATTAKTTGIVICGGSCKDSRSRFLSMTKR